MKPLVLARSIVVLLAVAGVVAACQRDAGVDTHNETDGVISIVGFRPDGLGGLRETALFEGLHPRTHVHLGGGVMSPADSTLQTYCTDHDLVARDASGTEIARLPPPACDGYVWVITLPSASPR